MSMTSTTPELVSVVEDEKKIAQLSRITQYDEADLEWFWCFGEAAFERSTFGAVIERQSLYAEMTELCLACDGFGTDQTSGSRCVPCRGKGRIRVGLLDAASGFIDSTKACPDCYTDSGYRRANVNPDDCAVCGGDQYVGTDAVGISCMMHGEGGYEPDDVALQRYARVSKRLSELERRNRVAADVLHAYYGVDGLRWGGTDHGRLTALLPQTLSGKKFIQEEPNRLGLGARELFANAISRHFIKKTPGKTALLMRATGEAGRLYINACEAWNKTGRDV